jgi:hypothetical protein
MKILVIGMPRSRSNYLKQCISKHYKIKNVGEPYQEQYERLKNPLRLENFPYFANIISNQLREDNKSFVCKLQTTNIPGRHLVELDNYKHFQFEMYDQIYITVRRNLVEQICSTIVAVKTGNFVFRDVVPNIPPGEFTFDIINDSNLFAETFTNLLRIRFAIKHLKSQGIPFNVVYYEDCPTWVSDNLGTVDSDMVETNFNYSKIFNNYTEMQDVVQAYFGSYTVDLIT